MTDQMQPNIGEVLRTLRDAAREIKNESGTQEARPDWGGASSTKQLLLQTSALHKGFLALSDALLEISEASRQQSAAWDGSLEAVRQEFLAKVELACALHADLQQLITLEAGLQAQNTMLTDRVASLEDEAASLRAQLEHQVVEAGQAIQNQVTQAANTHFEEHLHHFEQERMQPLVEAALQQQVQQWAASELKALVQQEVERQAAGAVQSAVRRELQALQGGMEASQQVCDAAVELAAHAAADVAALVADVQHLTAWCHRVDAAHANHEERLRRLEGTCAAEGPPAAADAAPVGRNSLLPQQGALYGGCAAVRLLEQEGRLSRLEEAARLSSDAPQEAAAGGRAIRNSDALIDGSGAASAREASGCAGLAGSTEQQVQLRLSGAGPAAGPLTAQEAVQAQLAAVQSQLDVVQHQLENVLSEAGELPAVQQRLCQLAAEQVQQASSNEKMVHAVLTDVMSLARHTKVLDGEVRALRGGVGQVQDALLTCSSTFARVLSIPSPIGPFTTFPPQ